MDWNEVLKNKEEVVINIGGGSDCHPKKNYINHVAVDLRAIENWGISHDLTKGIPLPDNSIERIISDHFFEHVSKESVINIFKECYRILKPGGNMRVAVPDYNHPREVKHIEKGVDLNHKDHIWLPTIEEFKPIIEESDFLSYDFRQYWTHEGFYGQELDYSNGYIKRTPENDKRNRKNKLYDYIDCYFKSFFHIIIRTISRKKIFLSSIRGNSHRATSIVVDMWK